MSGETVAANRSGSRTPWGSAAQFLAAAGAGVMAMAMATATAAAPAAAPVPAAVASPAAAPGSGAAAGAGSGRCATPWSLRTVRAITEWGARLAPPDLARQIVRRPDRFRQGVDAAVAAISTLRGAAPAEDLARRARQEAARIAALVRAHRGFDEVVEQAGRAAAWTAAAGQPLAGPTDDPETGVYCADFAAYVESTRPRIARVAYRRPATATPEHVLRDAGARARAWAEAIGREYRRVGGPHGVRGVAVFDDRSTAFAVSALVFNHSIADIAALLRWAWLDAGGGDRRIQITQDHDGKLLVLGLPRPAAPGNRP